MATHHKWYLEIGCSGCDARGKVVVLEDGGPPFGDKPRREFQVGEPFEVLGEQVHCKLCSLPVDVPV